MYLAIKDEAKPTSGAITGVEVGVRDMARVLLPLVRPTSVNLSLPPKKNSEKKCGKLKIEPLGEIENSDKNSQGN